MKIFSSVDLFICRSLLESFVGFKRRVAASALLLKGRKHFSQSVMVLLAVSKLVKTVPFFITPKAKVNSAYYCDEVLARGLLRDIRQLSGVDAWLHLSARWSAGASFTS